MNRPAYDEVSGLWEIEGSLRDVYVLQTDPSDWEKLMEFGASFSLTYTFDGTKCALPNVDSVFSNRDGSHLLRVNLGSATANCHFFGMSEIELDLDPREIQNPKTHDEVLSFIEGLAGAIRKPVLITPENGQRIPYLSFEPATSSWHVHE